MFVNFFHALRRRGVPVTFNEWLLLQHALSENLVDSSLTRFYYLARAILIKTEAHFDKYDQAFLECFGHIESDEDLIRTIEEQLLRMPPLELTEEEKRMVEQLSLEEVRAGSWTSCRTRMTSRMSEGTRRSAFAAVRPTAPGDIIRRASGSASMKAACAAQFKSRKSAVSRIIAMT